MQAAPAGQATPQQISGRCCRVWLPDSVLPAGDRLLEALEGANGANFQHLNRKHVGATFRVFGAANPDAPPWKRLQVVAQCHLDVDVDKVEADLLDLAETACDIVADGLRLTDDQVQQAFDDIRYERTDIKLAVAKGRALTGSLAGLAQPHGVPHAGSQGSASSFSKASLGGGAPLGKPAAGATLKAPGAAPIGQVPKGAAPAHQSSRGPVPAAAAATAAAAAAAAATGAAAPGMSSKKEKKSKEKKEKRATQKQPLSDVRLAEQELSKTRQRVVQKRLEEEAAAKAAQAAAAAAPLSPPPAPHTPSPVGSGPEAPTSASGPGQGLGPASGSSSSSSSRLPRSSSASASAAHSGTNGSSVASGSQPGSKRAGVKKAKGSTAEAAPPGPPTGSATSTSTTTTTTATTQAQPVAKTSRASKAPIVSQKPDELTEEQKLMPPPPIPPAKRQKLETNANAKAKAKAGAIPAQQQQQAAAMSVDQSEESDDGEDESEEEEDAEGDDEVSSSGDDVEEVANASAEPRDGGPAPFDPIKVRLSKLGERCCVAFACYAGGNPGPELLLKAYSIDQRVKLEHCKDDIESAGEGVTIWKFVASTGKKHLEGMAALCDYFRAKQRVGMVYVQTYTLYLVPPDPAFLKGINLLDPSLSEQQDGCILGVQVPLPVVEDDGYAEVEAPDEASVAK